VPPLIQSALSDVQVGSEIVFSEIEDGIEKNRTGLKNFIYYPFQNKDIFVFDNHNHAFFFWLAGYTQGKIKSGLPLVHIDQHTDMREPLVWPAFSLNKIMELKKVFDYTNFVLNVGNFIKPALKLGLFSDVQIIDSTTSFEKHIPSDFILDIFSEDMAYINDELKTIKIKQYIQNSSFITIATSPYFINQEYAFEKLLSLILK